MGYKNLSKEELKKLPLDKLAEIAHEALQNWDRLNQRLNQDSTNSGRAPSSDSPETRAKRKAEQESKTVRHGARKQGAQVGHKGHAKPLLELRDTDIVIDCLPTGVCSCGASLEGLSDAEPARFQKCDVEIRRIVTEYRKHRITCPGCGKTSEGKLPAEAPAGEYGPMVSTLEGLLTGVCHISRRMACLLLEKLFEIPISVGTVSKLEKELTSASEPVMKEIEHAAQSASRGNADETGFGLAKGRRAGCGCCARRWRCCFAFLRAGRRTMRVSFSAVSKES